MPDGPDRRTGYEKFFGKSYRTHLNEGCVIIVFSTVLMILVAIGTYGCMYAIASSSG